MGWPGLPEYRNALQNPRWAFLPSTGLHQATVSLLDGLGLPSPIPGALGCVFQLKSADRKWAVKCFTQDVPFRHEHYNAVSEYLNGLGAEWGSPLIEFQYFREGIRAAGNRYPIVRMSWIDGDTLDEYVAKALNEPKVLELLADKCRLLVSRLKEKRIAHGDLQHGNIMIARDGAKGRIRLVDYDGMFVPTLQGKPCSEKGHANYQSRLRIWNGTQFDDRLDHFSAIVIYLSIRALADDRDLWRQFHLEDANLLFTSDDLQNPGKTDLWRALARSQAAEVRNLSLWLQRWSGMPFDRVPDLDGAISKARNGPPPIDLVVTRPTPADPGKTRPSPTATPQPQPAPSNIAADYIESLRRQEQERQRQSISSQPVGAGIRLPTARANVPSTIPKVPTAHGYSPRDPTATSQAQAIPQTFTYRDPRERRLSELAEGQLLSGIVQSVKDFGVFVDIGGIDGLLPIREMSWGHVTDPENIVRRGQQVLVKVINIDTRARRITLSLRQAGPSPWDRIDQNYTPGSTVTGTVTRTTKYGAFVELEPGVEGLVHISELSASWVNRVCDEVSVGEKVQVQVISVDAASHRIALSRKAILREAGKALTPSSRGAATYGGSRTRTLRGGLGK